MVIQLSKVVVGLFEDVDYGLLNPLSLLRPVYEIRNGMLSNRERLEKVFRGRKYCLFTRDYLSSLLKWKLNIIMNREDIYVNELVKGCDVLLINGRVLLNEFLVKSLRDLLEVDGSVVGLSNSDVVALRLTSDVAEKFKLVLMRPFHLELLSDLEGKADIIEINAELVEDPMDFLTVLSEQLEFDFKLTNVKRELAHVRSEVHKNAVLDETEGSVVISRSSKLSNSVIRGPLFIGENSMVTGSDITRAVVGSNCRIMNSVVKDSIIMDNVTIHGGTYINKAIIGSWSKVMPSACLCGELIKRHEWKREGEYVTIGDYCIIGPGAVIYPGVSVGAFSSVHGVCESKVGAFELTLNSIRRKLPLEDIIELVQSRVREVNKFISDHELNVIRRVYGELS